MGSLFETLEQRWMNRVALQIYFYVNVSDCNRAFVGICCGVVTGGAEDLKGRKRGKGRRKEGREERKDKHPDTTCICETHFRASFGLLQVVVSQMLAGNSYTTLPFFCFVCTCDRIPACALKCVSSSLPGICSLREISRRAAYANRRPRHDSRNGEPPRPLPMLHCSLELDHGSQFDMLIGLREQRCGSEKHAL